MPAATGDALRAYLELLGRWNQRINLTAFELDPPSDDAIDRLLVEPLMAARRLLPGDRLVIDVGSGGGSPAIPLKLSVPVLRMVLVEAKVRKSAFLREAIRQLSLEHVEVENRPFEELLSRSDLHEAADVVTIRAVRADTRLWTGGQAFLKPGGRVFWFASASPSLERDVLLPLVLTSDEALIPSKGSHLRILSKLA